MLLDPVSTRRDSREKMTETMYRHAMSTAFKNWHSLALAAVLYAVNVFLLSIGNDMISKSNQSLGGWVVLVGALAYAIGYFLLFNVAPPLQSTQALAAAVTLIVGGAIYLVAILVGVAAAFVRPRK